MFTTHKLFVVGVAFGMVGVVGWVGEWVVFREIGRSANSFVGKLVSREICLSANWSFGKLVFRQI